MFAYYVLWLPKFSDRSYALSAATVFPLARIEIETFEDLKKGLLRACLVSIIDNQELRVECDASEVQRLAKTIGQSPSCLERFLPQNKNILQQNEKLLRL